MKTILIATAKDEGHNVLEWVAHHRLCGFTDFVLFQNDSTDGTDQTMQCLADLGVVQYFNNPAPPGWHQRRAYRRAEKMPDVQNSDYAMVLDFDEFLNIRIGDHTLTSLIKALPDFDHLIVNWRAFGSGQTPDMSDDLITRRFTDTISLDSYKAVYTGYKSLFKPATFSRPGIHQPRLPQKPEDEIIRVNASGMVAPDFPLRNWRSKDPQMTRFACVHHYAVKDIETFLLKSVRGSAHQADRLLREDYWLRNNLGGTADFSLADRAPQLWDEMQKLDQMSGGRLMELRAAAFAHHRATLENLRSAPEFEALRTYCQNTPPSVV